MDIVGSLLHSKGTKYGLTIVERFTRWPEAILIANITAEVVARHLFFDWITQYHGVPNYNGPRSTV